MSISWDEYFMGLAILSSKRSKDPSKQVGAVIVNNDKKIVSIGYNGFPKTIQNNNDNTYSWSKEEKNLYVVHAEENCILNGDSRHYDNCTMYCTLFPCNKCTQSIIQVNIKKIIYFEEKEDNNIFIASRKMLDNACVEYNKYDTKNKEISIIL